MHTHVIQWNREYIIIQAMGLWNIPLESHVHMSVDIPWGPKKMVCH